MFEREVMEAVEVAMKTEVVLGPNALERLDELFRATIALIVFQPRLANGPKLVLEPARHDIDRDPPVGELVDGGQLFGRQHWTQGPGRMAAITLSFSVAANSLCSVSNVIGTG